MACIRITFRYSQTLNNNFVLKRNRYQSTQTWHIIVELKGKICRRVKIRYILSFCLEFVVYFFFFFFFLSHAKFKITFCNIVNTSFDKRLVFGLQLIRFVLNKLDEYFVTENSFPFHLTYTYLYYKKQKIYTFYCVWCLIATIIFNEIY